MHLPDGFVDAPTSIGAAVVATAAVGVVLRRTPTVAPLTGLLAAFLLAAQMLNVPVAAGTSGHVLGAVLAVVLVGPRAALLASTTVVVVQALLLADGGISAIGLNVVNLAVVPVVVGLVVFRAVRFVTPPGRTAVLAATALAAWASVVAAAAALSIQYAVGGVGAVPAGTFTAAMLTIHAGIGLLEAAVSVAIVGTVLGSRPDLVHGAEDLRRGATVTVG